MPRVGGSATLARSHADRLASALVLCRDSAARGLPLSFDQLAEWQAVVLGEHAPVAFRSAVAYAKNGREMYRIDSDVADEFDRALADASDTSSTVATRAARAYLDLCFFHPFPDGNARAARLALDHVLSSNGLWLRDADDGIAAAPRARVFATGANRWLDLADWPPVTTLRRFFLHSAGLANTRNGDGLLSEESPGNEPPDTFVYDPASPVVVGTFDTPSGALGVAVAGIHAYVAASGLHVVDVADPASPSLVGTVHQPAPSAQASSRHTATYANCWGSSSG